MVTAMVIRTISSNLALSLGMVGALSIVRFRTAIKEPRDLLFLFWSISNGIIIGSQIYSIAIVLAVVLGVAMLFFDIVPEKKTPCILVIYYKSVEIKEIENILMSNRIKYKFKSNNITTKESSCIYEISIKKNKDFINDISDLGIVPTKYP